MVIIKFDATPFDFNTLGEDLKDLGVQCAIKKDVEKNEVILRFPDLHKIEDKDEEGIVVSTSYLKLVGNQSVYNGEDAEGNEIYIDKPIFEPFDFATLKATIESVKSAHDPTARAKKEANEEIYRQLKEKDLDLNRGTEDLIELLIIKDVITESELPQQLRDRKSEKENLRSQLQEI